MISFRSLERQFFRQSLFLSRGRPNSSFSSILSSSYITNTSYRSTSPLSTTSLPPRPQFVTGPSRPSIQYACLHANAHSRSLSTETRSAIDKAVGSAPVVLFMKGTPETPQCGFSRASIQILGLQGVDPGKFTAFNVLEDEELRQGIKEYSDWPTIPQLYVDKEFVGGCDILVSMHQDGSLAKLLEEKSVVVPAEEGKSEQSQS